MKLTDFKDGSFRLIIESREEARDLFIYQPFEALPCGFLRTIQKTRILNFMFQKKDYERYKHDIEEVFSFVMDKFNLKVEPIYWGAVPVTSYHNGVTRELISDMLIDISFVLQFHDDMIFKGALLA